MRCIACNRKLESWTKKRPLTTHSGHLLDKFRDHIEDFPKHEHEDLCNLCKDSINGINHDTNELSVEYDTKVHHYDIDTSDGDDYRLDVNFEASDEEYNGWLKLEETLAGLGRADSYDN